MFTDFRTRDTRRVGVEGKDVESGFLMSTLTMAKSMSIVELQTRPNIYKRKLCRDHSTVGRKKGRSLDACWKTRNFIKSI